MLTADQKYGLWVRMLTGQLSQADAVTDGWSGSATDGSSLMVRLAYPIVAAALAIRLFRGSDEQLSGRAPRALVSRAVDADRRLCRRGGGAG